MMKFHFTINITIKKLEAVKEVQFLRSCCMPISGKGVYQLKGFS